MFYRKINFKQGKGYPTLKEDDFFSLKFDKKIIDKLFKSKDKIEKEINEIEDIINKLKSSLIEPQKIIDKVFIREFGFDEKKFGQLKQIRKFFVNLTDFSNNIDLRNSVKFHKEAGAFVRAELSKITNKKIKHFISQPIVLGASISPSDFNKDGSYYYVSMASVKTSELELDESQLVSNEYAEANANKLISKDDIIMTRSGVAIGKFAIVKEDIKAVFADFTMRIRLKDYSPLFAYYYFRSSYFQYLIYINKKGLQNQNIFPIQIQEFPLIDIPIERQKKIVEEIKLQLDKQVDTLTKIDIKRQEIDDIIKKSVE
jgi:restriction endonuclease S subunit